MMPTARVLIATAVLCLTPLQGAIAAAYKWVDDKGETHYSQTPPTATSVEIIKTPASQAPVYDNPDTDTDVPDAAKTEDAAIRAKNCNIARSNLEALKNPGDVTFKDARGLLHTLTAEERVARRDLAEKEIKEFCKE